MKKLFLSLIFIAAALAIKAQVPSNVTPGTWQNAILRADGTTEVGGVEAYCMKATCDNEEYILIKFVNKNDYKVGVEWIDAIYVNGEWYYSKNPAPKKLYLEPGNTIGECSGEIKLKLQINSIIDNTNVLYHYTVSGLAIIK